MQIESIEIRNYRLFRLAELKNLPRLTIVVGANGSGKSTLFDVFSFLKESLAQSVAVAVARRGGFRELVSRDEKGPIGILVKFRESGGRLATYQLEIGEDGGRPVVAREVLKFRRGQYGQPWHFVDFSRGKGTAITNESAYGQEGVEAERKEYALDDPSVLAIKGLGNLKSLESFLSSGA
jgi:predicted ATPase